MAEASTAPASSSSSSSTELGAAAGDTLGASAEAAAIAPDSLRGWGTLQRALNTTLPLRLNEAERVLEQADRTLAGLG